MLKNEEHEILKRLKPHVNDPLMFDVFALLKYYEARALEKLVECTEQDVKALQGEIKSLRRVVAKIKAPAPDIKNT